ncbi:lipase/acylhydrolase [Caballeronia choica]|uniref:Lipase/acylhydrolase n=1 Tax=Caballeronia choica TaxID=326476 RepID=A0A158KA09_9BURK|nr:hypothetical protein [Caballeronia choica]SAL77619.1 lipase/acylhydrolase [Caballeronia choica]
MDPDRPESGARRIYRAAGRAHYFAHGTVSSAPWIGTWSVAPSTTGDAGFNNQTVRQILHTSIGGTSARIRLSNLFGTQPLVIGDVRIARRARGQKTVSGSDRAVTFGGQPNVTIPVGASVVSDTVAFQVPALADVAISLYLPQQTPHTRQATSTARRTSISRPGTWALIQPSPAAPPIPRVASPIIS